MGSFLLLVLVLLGFLALREMLRRPVYCPACGHLGKPRRRMRGSLALEVLLYFFFLLPGLIYTLWRGSTDAPVCALCGQTGVIPPDSPRARALRGEDSPELDTLRRQIREASRAGQAL